MSLIINTKLNDIEFISDKNIKKYRDVTNLVHFKITE